MLSSQPACDQAPCLFADVDCGDETPLFNSLSTPAGEVVKTWFSCPGDLDLGTVVTAFKQMTLDPGVLVIEPPDHVTLVNFDTNFYTTTTEPVSKSVVLLEQQVTIEATPSAYDWTFGDGESLRTKIPGAPYPRLDVTHNYLRKGDYLPALSTTYTGRFKVGDGAWQTIPGTVTIPGTGQPLRAIEAKPKLVGY